MTSVDKKINNDFSNKTKKLEKIKENLLDETFRKAELLKKKYQSKGIDKKKINRKSFPVSSLVFIIIAVVAIAFISYLPWMYIRYNAGQTETDVFIYNDFNQASTNQEISNLFGSNCNNCNNISQNYIGLSIDDFYNTPKITLYGFIALIILSVSLTIFALINKYRNYSIEAFSVIYSSFAIIEIIVGIIILISCMKFIGAYFLSSYNTYYIEGLGVVDARIVYLTPILIIIFAFIIIRIAMAVVDINFRELDRKNEFDNPQRKFFTTGATPNDRYF